VTDDEILAAKAVIDGAGVGCEPASAASVAGVRRLVREGVIAPTARAVAILTGHLLKDPEILLAGGRESSVEEVDANLASIGAALGGA
jgi:threonine synthase